MGHEKDGLIFLLTEDEGSRLASRNYFSLLMEKWQVKSHDYWTWLINYHFTAQPQIKCAIN